MKLAADWDARGWTGKQEKSSSLVTKQSIYAEQTGEALVMHMKVYTHSLPIFGPAIICVNRPQIIYSHSQELYRYHIATFHALCGVFFVHGQEFRLAESQRVRGGHHQDSRV